MVDGLTTFTDEYGLQTFTEDNCSDLTNARKKMGDRSPPKYYSSIVIKPVFKSYLISAIVIRVGFKPSISDTVLPLNSS